MILAVDVYYRDNTAIAAGVLFNRWGDCKPADELVTHISKLETYTPGEFYRRELPCILAILKQLENLPEYIIVDGYVYLDKNKKPEPLYCNDLLSLLIASDGRNLGILAIT